MLIISIIGGAALYFMNSRTSDKSQFLTAPTPIPPLFSPAPSGMEAPEKGEKRANSDIASPIAVAPAGSGAKIRTFEVKAFNNVYDPNTIVADEGDAIIIKFTAVGKMYDITAPAFEINTAAKAGETKTLQFNADNPGKHLFFCDLCGGQNSSTRGFIIIIPKGGAE